jgi:hypothetical protein
MPIITLALVQKTPTVIFCVHIESSEPKTGLYMNSVVFEDSDRIFMEQTAIT